MTPEELIQQLKSINVWRRGAERAPHKALLVLLSLGRVSRDEARMQPFSAIEKELTKLLNRFGPQRRKQRPQDPFQRLEPELWEISGVDNPTGSKDLPVSVLREKARGGFQKPVEALLRSDSELVLRAAEYLLATEFAESYHDDILDAVGLHRPAGQQGAFGEDSRQTARDPAFRIKVIDAYQHRCAVCGYDIRLQDDLVGLEAAHILWHARGGPDEVPNGLALCAIHHKALDRGGISLDDDLNLLVSPQLHGYHAVDSLFLDFEGRPIRHPRKSTDAPKPEYLAWHRNQVYRPDSA